MVSTATSSPMNQQSFTVRLSPALAAGLRACCKQKGQPQSTYIRLAIEVANDTTREETKLARQMLREARRGFGLPPIKKERTSK